MSDSTLYENSNYKVELLDTPIEIYEKDVLTGYFNYAVVNKDTGATEQLAEYLPAAISNAMKFDEFMQGVQRDKINASVVPIIGGKH